MQLAGNLPAWNQSFSFPALRRLDVGNQRLSGTPCSEEIRISPHKVTEAGAHPLQNG